MREQACVRAVWRERASMRVGCAAWERASVRMDCPTNHLLPVSWLDAYGSQSERPGAAGANQARLAGWARNQFDCLHVWHGIRWDWMFLSHKSRTKARALWRLICLDSITLANLKLKNWSDGPVSWYHTYWVTWVWATKNALRKNGKNRKTTNALTEAGNYHLNCINIFNKW